MLSESVRGDRLVPMAIPLSPTDFFNRLRASVAGVVLWFGLGLPTPSTFAQSTTVPVNETVTAPTPSRSAARILWLRAEIARHDELYFKQNAPEISDAAYDQLKRELQRLENTLNAPSKSSAIGDDRSGDFPTARHGQPMLSLAKTYTETELRAFITHAEQTSGGKPLRWVVEPKFDGLAISVTYEQGRLVRALTRGDGQQGDDVTANIRTISGLPDTLPTGYPQRVELRGEVFIDYAEFARLNTEREEAGLAPFAHPRNLAAGTLKQHDPSEVAKRHLRIVFYGLGTWDGPPAAPATQTALHAQVRTWGLPGVESVAVNQTADDVWNAVTQLGRHRAALEFPTDGAVVKIDDVQVQRKLGANDEVPHWAVAYKFPPERVSTRLLAINLQVGRTGIVTPVAELEPVVIGGTTIARASLYNADAIARRDLRVGDWVFIEKAGEIIPVVVESDTTRRTASVPPFQFPTLCPACDERLIRNEGEAAIRCVQRDCPGQLRRRIEHFASTEAAGIKGLGPSLIAFLVETRRVKTVADLYRLQHADLVGAGGQSALNAEALLAQIERSKHASMARIIYGLSIPGVGKSASVEWAGRFTDLAQWAEASRLELSERDSVAADAVVAYFALEENRRLIADLKSLGIHPKKGNDTAGAGALVGKTVVLTGALPSWTRAEATQRIEAAGGRVVSEVSRRTDLVVAGEGAGAKLTAARTLGIEIISEQALLQRLTP